jgi:general secretion pathway protein I
VKQPHHSPAFTLLEVLVALAVIAVALSAILKVSVTNVENNRYLRDRTLAHWVAMNVLTEIQVRNEWLAVGTKEGKQMMANHEWHWTVNTSETIDKELRRLEVTVRYQHDDSEPLAILIGFVSSP